MTPSEQSDSVAAARLIRDQFIALTHELPGAPEYILRLWNVADQALADFIIALEASRS